VPDARKAAILLETLEVFDLGPSGREVARKLRARQRSKRP
jgi:hypothetical protein